MASSAPRIMIAGAGGDSGKTLVCLGLLARWRESLPSVRAFKKGPDFIDAAWLGWAAGSPGRNLDTFMMGEEVAARSFAEHACDGINVIEGNRGLLDGLDARGAHSSAALARLLDCPVVLVVSPVKVTATAAAVVAGCRLLAPEVRIAGVVLNSIRGERHRQVVSRAIEELAGVPVLGALPRLEGGGLVSRHLGLVPPAEHRPAERMRRQLADLVADHLDLDRLLEIAREAPAPAPIPATGAPAPAPAPGAPLAGGGRARVGYFNDSAFTFYYPENLEALRREGAELLPISALSDRRLPPLDALYIGGGFPETHTDELAANGELLAAVREAVAGGLPTYAECGGLMYLAESLEWARGTVRLAGALPLRVRLHESPQGHGYCVMRVDRPNPFLPVGTELRGHEFHYSRITAGGDGLATAYAVERGVGSLAGRDGIVRDNLLASYLHLHALGTPAWAPGLVAAAAAHRLRSPDPAAGGGRQRTREDDAAGVVATGEMHRHGEDR